MLFTRRQALLRGRYELVRGPIADDQSSETWLGIDDVAEVPYLMKVWPFRGPTPDPYQRALWDRELRMLYRVGSSPGADRALVVVRDAGVDLDAGCFVMVLAAVGYEPLSGKLRERKSTSWLSTREVGTRRELWLGLQRVADGIRLLHEQNMLHRDVEARSVYLDNDVGPTSFRLGGFEWSVRLGVPAASVPPVSWSTPPEFAGSGTLAYRPETDWFGFGMLAARCLLNLENYSSNDALDRYERTYRAVERANRRDMSEREQDFLLRLIRRDPSERLTRSYEVRATIEDIVSRLDFRSEQAAEAVPLVLVMAQDNDDLREHAHDLGYVPDPGAPQEPYNPLDPIHANSLTRFYQERLADSQLHRVPGQEYLLLIGEGIHPLRVARHRTIDRATGTQAVSWDLAFCVGLGELRGSRGGTEAVNLPLRKVVVRSLAEVNRDRSILQQSEAWTRYLPTEDQAERLRASLSRFHDFIRCTNQIELLIRDSEVFRYEVVEADGRESGTERVVIAEVERERPVLGLFKIEHGLAQFLQQEIESNKPHCREVMLTDADEDGLVVSHVDPTDCWEVTSIDLATGRVELTRVAAGRDRPPPPDPGTIRAWGMFGQVALIRRRKRAIDRLERHSYLLRSLAASGQVYMDTGSLELPVPLSEDEVDEAKQAAIEDILRVRPIYALQGPPGTGKTTLVAHLLRQLLKDDPVGQILITAQAHGAVDVLREKVRTEAFREVPEAEQPLAVRLGRGGEDNEGTEDWGSVRRVSLSILESARTRLRAATDVTALTAEWLSVVEDMIASVRTWAADRDAPEFMELVKRGANLIYCTTSAGDLEELADLAQSFDWAILEEAGKAHGFDLALPLQAGHRWLLIGDHKQLPPYRFDEYSGGIQALGQVVDALWELPGRAGGLVDSDWLRSWQGMNEEEQEEFKEYAKTWLRTFKRIFELCRVASGAEMVTVTEPAGAAAGMLSGQHRMHPTIGSLISAAYYDDELVNRTLDSADRPVAQVVHPFTNPFGIAGRALVWLNTPYAADVPDFHEQGPSTGAPRFTNRREVEVLGAFLRRLRIKSGWNATEPLELAVLSPYNQQVALINRSLRDVSLPEGVVLKADPRRRRRGDAEALRLAHTVDSFQGNQADVVVVSLVRNNDALPGEGLGFLRYPERINVLLSRAERLLVLVGSWDFFATQLAATSIDDERASLWNWKKVLVTLADWFESGRAVRIDSDELASL
jgi:AAA domain/Protein kinase domain